MAFKFVTFIGLVCLTSAVPNLEYASPIAAKTEGLSYGYEAQRAPIAPIAPVAPVYNEFGYNNQFAPAAYDFSYAVHDQHTGDIKSQKEVRNGDSVQGRYELIDSDGFRRIVEYTADNQNGFNAIVHREPVDIRIPQPIPQEPKLTYTAPIIKDIPVQAQPVNKAIVYNAPQYTVQNKSPRYYVNPAYATTSYAPAPSAQVQSAPVYNSPIHSSAFENAEQAYQAYRYPVQSNPAYIQGYSAPVYSKPVYSSPAYKAQIYSVPNQKLVSYPSPAYNTQVYSAPAHAVQSYTNIPAAQGYYSAPVAQHYFAAPAVTKLAYSAHSPAPAVTYTKQTSDAANYYVTGTPANNVHLQSRFTPIQVTPSQVSTYSTPAPILSSVAPKTDVEVNSRSAPSGSEQSGVTASYGAYTVSSTPSYKH